MENEQRELSSQRGHGLRPSPEAGAPQSESQHAQEQVNFCPSGGEGQIVAEDRRPSEPIDEALGRRRRRVEITEPISTPGDAARTGKAVGRRAGRGTRAGGYRAAHMHGTTREPNRGLLRGTITAWLRRVNQRSIGSQQQQAFNGERRHKGYVRSPAPGELRQAAGEALFLAWWITSPGFHFDAGLAVGLILPHARRAPTSNGTASPRMLLRCYQATPVVPLVARVSAGPSGCAAGSKTRASWSRRMCARV